MEFTKAYLERLITEQIEENLHLDYKASASLSRSEGNKKEITKDISCFANADGGHVVYGISEYQEKERKHLPERFDPVNIQEFSKEWLDQICGLINPRIKGLIIHPVHVGPKIFDYCFVVEIPKSETLHQARDDRYHRRRNFESTPMQDYEIREAWSRRKHPKLECKIRRSDNGNRICRLSIEVKNISNVIALRYALTVKVPAVRLPTGNLTVPNSNAEFPDSGASGDCFIVYRLNNLKTSPLFPGFTEKFEIHILGAVNPEIDSRTKVFDDHDNYRFVIEVYADSMDPMILEKSFKHAGCEWV